MINENIDVKNCIANGTMCEFECVILKKGVSFESLENIEIDGYFVRCVSVCQVERIKLRLLDGLHKNEEIRFILLEPKQVSAKVQFPIPLYETIDRNTKRFTRGIRMKQFPLNCANARTIHKLQGRSIDNLVISSWDYSDNWIYVALSRVRTMNGLFLRLPLEHSKCRGMSKEVRQFMETMREKVPEPPVEIYD
jgi:hypothetical protein